MIPQPAEVTNSSTSRPLAAAEEVIAAAASGTVGASVVVGAAASAVVGSGAAEAQGFLILGFTSCASGLLRQLSEESLRFLLPLGRDLGEFESSALLGGLLIVGVVCFLQLLVTCILWRIKSSNFVTARGAARFPSITWSVANFLYQGVTLEAFRILFMRDATAVERNVAAATICGCIAMPIAATYWCKRTLPTIPFRVYDHSERNRILRMYLYVVGFWQRESPEIVSMSSVGGMLAGKRWWVFSGLAHLRTLLVSLIVSLPWLTNCTVQAILLFIVFLAYAALLAIYRPLRSRGSTVGGVAVSIVSAIVSLSLVSPSLDELSAWGASIASVVSILSIILTVLSFVIERYWHRRGLVKVIDGEDDDLERGAGSDDQEMLAVPLRRHSVDRKDDNRGDDEQTAGLVKSDRKASANPLRNNNEPDDDL